MLSQDTISLHYRASDASTNECLAFESTQCNVSTALSDAKHICLSDSISSVLLQSCVQPDREDGTEPSCQWLKDMEDVADAIDVICDITLCAHGIA